MQQGRTDALASTASTENMSADAVGLGTIDSEESDGSRVAGAAVDDTARREFGDGLIGDTRSVVDAMRMALHAADSFAGAVSPNPPVGCVLLDANGVVLAVEAHQRAGTLHAEARAIAACRDRATTGRIDTVVVTLEPCNHHGRTPPCVEAILATPARRVVIGATDPNLSVAGGGAARLSSAGLEVVFAHQIDPALARSCERLIAPFAKWVATRLPWLTVKTALNRADNMIPAPGQKTFTSPSSLALAHRLRRRSDAIITGSGTILADDPHFTVRHVADHLDKRRRLVILDRRARVGARYIADATERGFDVVRATSIAQALAWLGEAGAVEALLEAGPTLSRAVLETDDWDEHVQFRQAPASNGPDEVITRLRQHGADITHRQEHPCFQAS